MRATSLTRHHELMQGVDFLVVVIGLFGIGEILLTMEEGLSIKGKAANISPRIVLQTWAKLPRYWVTLVRSSIIGCWMGITPGGATAASFMSYGIAKKFSRNGDKFGTGQIEGGRGKPPTSDQPLLPRLTLAPGSATPGVGGL